jgi:hypothetical protein
MHPIPDKEHWGRGGGTAARRDSVRTPFGQSGSLRGLELVPVKWRCLVPPTSTPEGAYPQGATQTHTVGLLSVD